MIIDDDDDFYREQQRIKLADRSVPAIFDEDIKHFGVKGMRWGVRNERKTSNKPKEKTSKKKNAAIILSSAAAVAAIAVGAYFVKKRLGTKLSDIPAAKESTKKFAESMAKEPIGIVHASRGRNRGFTFPQRGGLSNPIKEYDISGLSKTEETSFFARYGNSNEKVAARFLDPLGRKDRAGRLIPHDVMLPKDMAKDVHNIDDVIKVSWPRIKDVFGALYESASDANIGPGY